ncbi:MAG: type II secretion system protein N [Sandarakinorhabdus sp.]|nr:type II secretion system protein N [Sandarakinorhabdus sp.]
MADADSLQYRIRSAALGAGEMKRWLIGPVLLVGVAAAAAWQLPLHIVVARAVPGLTATAITGTVWHGRLEAAAWQGTQLGDLDVGLDPRALLGGKIRIDFVRPATGMTGRLGVGGGVNRIERLNGVVAMALPFAFVDTIDIALSDAALTVDDAGRCIAAGGSVATVLTGVPLIGTSPELRGVAACDGEWLRLPLYSADGRIGLDVRVAADRRYRADIDVQARALPVRLALAAAGFELSDGRATLAVAGTL